MSERPTFTADLFAGRSVLVTGGTSGIGLACARAFRDHGATVTATGLDARECAAAAEREEGRGIAFVPLDVRDGSAVAERIGGLDRLDVLVTAAGLIRRDDEHDPAVFEQVIAVNLTGTMRACAAARPLLARTGGSIVTVASMLTFFGAPRAPAYGASKGGVGQLTKSLAAAYAAEGVRVNAVAPGWIRTPLTGALQDDPARSGPILARTPMGRWGEPDEVAGAALFLASPAARFVTGAILAVDGGYLTL